MLHQLPDEVIIEIHLLLDRILLDILDILLEQEGRHLWVTIGYRRPVFDRNRSIRSRQAECNRRYFRVDELRMAIIDVALE